ncbi:IclR family transcriptional regulator [Alkalihalobacillus oceani]|uniref:IclR family transcriptional regulator n=1 Tax=Halalkalibacter oceani TaxID=1653776 RepID=A0A9X2DW40_9BACI|nr:IclR family transcriptional regulator [Halalkalibacter oceani]MCM3716515.1 IclR family transcriptional regulator [Halalkalibacter oceani]
MAEKMGVVNKTFLVIKAFVDVQSEWGVRDLAKHLNFPVSTLHRLVLQMQEEGILEYNDLTNKYKVGIEMIRISSCIASQVDIVKISRPLMEEFMQIHKETVSLIRYHPYERKIVFVDRVEGPDPLQYIKEIGNLQPLIRGAAGKSILALLPPEDMNLIFQEEKLSDEEIKSIMQQLETIRSVGYASTEGEHVEGAKGIASAILDASGKPIGAIAYTAPLTRFDSANELALAEDIKEISRKISSILGYRNT